MSSLSINSSAAITPGTKCSKAGVKQVYKGKTYTCVKSGKKLAWSKGLVVLKPTPTITATPTPKSTLNSTPPPMPMPTPTPSSSASNPFTEAAEKAAADKAAKDKAAAEKAAAEKAALDAGLGKDCIPGSKCPIGSTGPGGGIVFYDAGSQQSWGRYLEVAPNGWGGSSLDPFASWCNVSNMNFTASISDVALRATLGFEIGKGKANTNLMVAFCSSGAGVLASAYRGGGKGDWFLPSKDELNELCKYARNQPTGLSSAMCPKSTTFREGFEGRPGSKYWSSSEYDATIAWAQGFSNGADNINVGDQGTFGKVYPALVRPIRAF